MCDISTEMKKNNNKQNDDIKYDITDGIIKCNRCHKKKQNKEFSRYNDGKIYKNCISCIDKIKKINDKQKRYRKKYYKSYYATNEMHNIKRKVTRHKDQDKRMNLRYNIKEYINANYVICRIKLSDYKCDYCKKEIIIIPRYRYDEKQYSVDRIDNNCAHTKDNINVCCLDCQRRRGRKPLEEFLKGIN